MMHPRELRAKIRAGQHAGNTSGLCRGHLQLNVVILPEEAAAAFRSFCSLNPLPCPLLCELPPGERFLPSHLAVGCDVATDVPRYRVYRGGVLTEEVSDISSLWREDLVTFLLGCSFSFEELLISNGIPVRNVEQGTNVSMYTTSTPCIAAGQFSTNMVVSMRPIPCELVERTYELTRLKPGIHGAPMHHGDPQAIGITQIERPDYGGPVEMCAGDVPAFWPCGVTAIAAAVAGKCDLTITHSPGHMLVCDCTEEEALSSKRS